MKMFIPAIPALHYSLFADGHTQAGIISIVERSKVRFYLGWLETLVTDIPYLDFKN